MSTIHYVDALCGAGKTSAALNWAYEAARKGEKICFVQPTRALIDESYSILSKMDPDNTIEIEKIYYDKTEHVSPRLDRYLRDVTSRGTILFITQSAYLNLRYFHNSQQWHLCMDELLVPFEDISVNISNTASIFLKGLKSYRYNELLNSIHFEKGERHPLKLKKNKGDKDEVQEVLRDLTKYLNNKHYKVLVVASNWLQYNQRSNRHKFQAVAVFDLQVLTTFKTTIVMGAMLADSLLSALVQLENSRDSDLHVCLKEFAPISKRMYNNVREHKIKGLVTIKYAYDRNWTKTFAHAATKNLIANTDIVQSNFIQAFITRVDQEFKDRQFIYSCNKSEEEQLLNTFHMGAKVSGTPHGLNKFKDYQCAAYLTSNNPSPTFFYTLKLLGIDSEKVRKQLYLQNIYQFVMRISLRDPYSTENVTLIVPDYCAACFLNKIFPNSVVEKFEGMPEIQSSKLGRKFSQFTKSQTKRTRDCLRLKILDEVITKNKNESKWLINESRKKYNNNTYIYSIKDIVNILDTNSSISVQFYLPYSNLCSTKVPNEVDSILQFTFSEYVKFLKQCAQDKTTMMNSKTDSPCLTASIFKDESKTLSSVDYSFGIWLDFDGGELSIRNFLNLFKNNYVFYCNTYTASKNRFRIFLPTNLYLSAAAHSDIAKSIVRYIEYSGYYIPKVTKSFDSTQVPSGKKLCLLDRTKLNANSLFYIPRLSERPYEKKYNFCGIQEGKFLDVLFYLQNPLHDCVEYDEIKRPEQMSSIDENIDVVSIVLKEEQAGLIEFYKSSYRSVPPGQGKRNYAFFNLGLKLAGLRIPAHEVESHLVDADYDSSRRKKGINSYMRSLFKYNKITS